MRPHGFSTGALAKGDFRHGVALQANRPEIRAIELSAQHLPVHGLAAMAFRRLVHRVPADCAVIIESVIPPESMGHELATVRDLFEVGSPAIA